MSTLDGLGYDANRFQRGVADRQRSSFTVAAQLVAERCRPTFIAVRADKRQWPALWLQSFHNLPSVGNVILWRPGISWVVVVMAWLSERLYFAICRVPFPFVLAPMSTSLYVPALARTTVPEHYPRGYLFGHIHTGSVLR